jgi:hypothetical protein
LVILVVTAGADLAALAAGAFLAGAFFAFFAGAFFIAISVSFRAVSAINAVGFQTGRFHTSRETSGFRPVPIEKRLQNAVSQ